MRREEFRAMGTTISLLLPKNQSELGLKIVRSLFTEWEQTLSRFLPDSELSRLNQQSSILTPVSNLLYQVLTTALAAAEATHGVYDPTMHEQLVHLGYDRTFEDLPPVILSGKDRPVFPGEPGGAWRGIRVGRQFQTITLPVGTKLDFGGIAKGMAVDAALQRLQQSGVESAMVNAGGDLAVIGLPPKTTHWQLSIPGRQQSWTIPLRQGAMATSGIAHRHWRQDQNFRHHLLDPQTGLPAQNDLWSVTVVADRCEQAEIAAKVAFILGSRQGADFLAKHRIAGLLVRQDGTWETVAPWPVQLMEEEQ
jgi:thiamine biosynthesis lipoprotein